MEKGGDNIMPLVCPCAAGDKNRYAVKTIRTELEKRALPRLCPQSPAANRPNVSCPVGKDGGRAKEAPVGNWSMSGLP